MNTAQGHPLLPLGRRPDGCRRRLRSSERRGFALLAVVLLLGLMTAAVALTLDEAVGGIQSAGNMRASAMLESATDHALNQAMQRLSEEDLDTLANPANDWDIFGGGNNPFLGPYEYPPDGPYANQFRVRVGLRDGQKTRAPAGEDVRTAFGQIVEVEIAADVNVAVSPQTPPAEERVAVGILIPRKSSHAK